MRDTLHNMQQEQDISDDSIRSDSLITDLEKLQHAENYYNWLAEVTEIFESGKIFDLIPKK